VRVDVDPDAEETEEAVRLSMTASSIARGTAVAVTVTLGPAVTVEVT
jgi:hypothetical protein